MSLKIQSLFNAVDENILKNDVSKEEEKEEDMHK